MVDSLMRRLDINSNSGALKVPSQQMSGSRLATCCHELDVTMV